MSRMQTTWRWLLSHPLALINLGGFILLITLFLYYATSPIDVLKNWEIATTQKGIDGKLPVYKPSGSLEFTSQSVKLISAEGETSRIFVCDKTKAQRAREIMLPTLPANRAPGVNPERENALTVPTVSEFNGLPRTCRLQISVCYENVILWRDHCETAVTNNFAIEEEELSDKLIDEKIKALEKEIMELNQTANKSSNSTSSGSATSTPSGKSSSSTATRPGNTTNNTTTNNTTNNPPVVKEEVQYEMVCDPIINLPPLLSVGQVNCREEAV